MPSGCSMQGRVFVKAPRHLRYGNRPAVPPVNFHVVQIVVCDSAGNVLTERLSQTIPGCAMNHGLSDLTFELSTVGRISRRRHARLCVSATDTSKKMHDTSLTPPATACAPCTPYVHLSISGQTLRTSRIQAMTKGTTDPGIDAPGRLYERTALPSSPIYSDDEVQPELITSSMAVALSMLPMARSSATNSRNALSSTLDAIEWPNEVAERHPLILQNPIQCGKKQSDRRRTNRVRHASLHAAASDTS